MPASVVEDDDDHVDVASLGEVEDEEFFDVSSGSFLRSSIRSKAVNHEFDRYVAVLLLHLIVKREFCFGI